MRYSQIAKLLARKGSLGYSKRMKPQDIVFFIVLGLLLYKRSPRFAAVAGLICLVLSIPLFATWTFFTAERLTWYAAAFFLLSIIFYLWQLRRK